MWIKPLVRDFWLASGRTLFPPNISTCPIFYYRGCDNVEIAFFFYPFFFSPPNESRNNAETLILCFLGSGSLSKGREGFLAFAASFTPVVQAGLWLWGRGLCPSPEIGMPLVWLPRAPWSWEQEHLGCLWRWGGKSPHKSLSSEDMTTHRALSSLPAFSLEAVVSCSLLSFRR